MRLVLASLFFASLVVASACSSGDGTGTGEGDGGGGDKGDASGESDGGTSLPSDGASSFDANQPGDAAVPGPCATYADKALGCCQAASSCGPNTRDTFLQYCAVYYASCQTFYTCYLGASTCAAADACPTLGSGGCN